MRVLVVDDDDASRYLIASLLTGRGHDVVEARDGREALAAARARAVDIAVSDILMPMMDGYTLAREWKADEALAPVPLVFYTASYTEPADRRFAESLGVDAFIVKPQEPDVLVRLIEDVLARHVSSGAARPAEPRDESDVLREYSERLVSKLEDKVVELDRANLDLRRALDALTDEMDVKKSLIEQLTSDIGERHRVEADLRAANELLGAVVSASPLGIVAVDADLAVRVWNPAAERLLGWEAADAVGRRYPPIAEVGEDEFLAAYRPMLGGDVDQATMEVRRRRSDGSWIDLIAHSAAVHGEDGSVTGLVTVFQDVTEQRHLEMVKSDFVSMVSHELRTPLTAIIGCADLLEQVDVHERPEQFRQLVATLRDRSEHMRRLIDDLLAVTQVRSGPLRLDLERVDTGEFVRVAAEAAMDPERHSLVFRASADLPALRVDRERLGAAIRHIVANAVKYSPDGGEVTVEVAERDGAVRIAVIDHGIGIAAADTAHVFDSFTQVDMSDTRPFGGVGLGLYLARQTVEAHHGRIEVDSAPGEGSTFTITLPVVG